MTRDSRLATRASLPWRRLVLSVLIVTLSTQPVFLLAAAFLQLEDDLGLSITGLGALSATFFLTAAIASAPLGRVVERIGWQRAMKINCVGSAAVLIAIALFARSVPGFVVLLVVGGAFYGFANPAANKALAEQVDADRRGITFGLKHAGIPSSTLLAGLAIPALILTVGWEFSFAVAALLAGPVWVLIAVDRDPLRQSAGARSPGRGARPLTVLDLVMLAAASALSAAAAISLGTFLIAAAVEEASFTQAAAGVLLLAGSLASISARIAVGAITDRIGGRGFTSAPFGGEVDEGVMKLNPRVLVARDAVDDVDQSDDIGFEAGLLHQLARRRLTDRFADLLGAAGNTPAIADRWFGALDQQDFVIAEHHDSDADIGTVGIAAWH